jgi:hypothetical protein
MQSAAKLDVADLRILTVGSADNRLAIVKLDELVFAGDGCRELERSPGRNGSRLAAGDGSHIFRVQALQCFAGANIPQQYLAVIFAA